MAFSLTAKQCREQFVTPLSCFPQAWCNSLAFLTPVLLRLLLDLDIFYYGRVDPLDVFPLILKMVEDIIAKKLCTIFLGLIRRGSFPEHWQSANATSIPNGAPSLDREISRPISMHDPYSVYGV